MKQVILILIIVLINIKEKTWINISKYYKSLALVVGINTFYYYLCKRKLVWEFTPKGIDWRVLRALHIFVATPLLTLLYLSKFPTKLSKQILYTIKWVFSSTAIEYYLLKIKLIKFKHGWNIYWSGLMYLKMYVYSYWFLRKPVSTSILTLCSSIFFVVKFKVPLEKRLFKGPFYLLQNFTCISDNFKK
jgi:hypothetical protein